MRCRRSPRAISGAEACRPVANETLPSLQTRKNNLEQDLKRYGRAADASRAQDAGRHLLDVLFQIDCLTTNEPALAKRSVSAKRSVTPAPGAPKEIVDVTTYYATNRNKVGGVEPAKVYGTTYQGNFQYGRAVVSIPARRTSPARSRSSASS